MYNCSRQESGLTAAAHRWMNLLHYGNAFEVQKLFLPVDVEEMRNNY